MQPLFPLFLDLAGRRVLLVGGGEVAAGKLTQLLAARAEVRVVAPEVTETIAGSAVRIERRAFTPADLDDVWLVIAAATPEVNREVAAAAEARRMFVNAVDDPANATAYLGGVVRRGGVTLAISTHGAAPGLAGLLREALDGVLPRELGTWVAEATHLRAEWRRDGVPMHERRPLLLAALNDLYESRHGSRLTAQGSRLETAISPKPLAISPSRTGHVSLVGAGPGDPGLLTRRAVARLRAADLVLYDALLDPRVVKLARRAQRFFVGKRAGRHAMMQPAINALMIRAARRGRRVVRLKGGDPFVFGRGGEEALALRTAGVSFDVVPGVTSAVAAPELAGVPVTHRGLSSAFLVVGGHDEAAFTAAVERVPSNGLTLVVMMGIARRAALAARLIDCGWDEETPAAIIENASKPGERVWRGTLGTLGSGQVDLDDDGPGTIVIGDVAALDARSSPFDQASDAVEAANDRLNRKKKSYGSR